MKAASTGCEVSAQHGLSQGGARGAFVHLAFFLFSHKDKTPSFHSKLITGQTKLGNHSKICFTLMKPWQTRELKSCPHPKCVSQPPSFNAIKPATHGLNQAGSVQRWSLQSRPGCSSKRNTWYDFLNEYVEVVFLSGLCSNLEVRFWLSAKCPGLVLWKESGICSVEDVVICGD